MSFGKGMREDYVGVKKLQTVIQVNAMRRAIFDDSKGPSPYRRGVVCGLKWFYGSIRPG